MSAEKLRFLAVAEVKVPWEVIYPCVVRNNSSSRNSVFDIVPAVRIEHRGVPQVEATVKICTHYDSIQLKIDEYQSSHLTKLKCTVTKTLRDATDPLPPEPITIRGGIQDIAAFPLNSVRCFSLLLKIYAVDRSLPSAVSALASRLYEARLRGDPQCDAFLFVEGGALPAHRLVLATQSQVFAKMFEGDFKEARDGHVTLKDTTKEAAEIFLEYLYTGYVEDYKELELELLDMAERYGVDDLKHQCRLRLWTVDAPRALRLLASPLVEDMRNRFAQIVLNANLNAEGVELITQEMQKEQPLAAYLMQAASTPPALWFPQP